MPTLYDSEIFGMLNKYLELHINSTLILILWRWSITLSTYGLGADN